jgi:hypothetical protein
MALEILAALAILLQQGAADPAEDAAAETPARGIESGAISPNALRPMKRAVENESDNRACRPSTAPGSKGEIVVCGRRPPRFRIDPDIMEAQRRARDQRRPKPPERMTDNKCATIGPMGCRGTPTVDLMLAATVLATIAQKAAAGQNVGQMFVTRPEQSEYQIYVELKHQREAKEAAEAAAKARAIEDAR